MAIYYCFECDNYIDNDWHPCEEHPNKELELVCPDCYERIVEEETDIQPIREIRNGNEERNTQPCN